MGESVRRLESRVAAPLVDPVAFRAIMGSFPSGVTVVTTLDEAGAPRGMTVSSFFSVSAEPPMLAVCLSSSSRTLDAVRARGAFVTHVLHENSVDVALHFARPRDDFGIEWRPSVHAGGAPILLSGVAAHAECSVERIVEAGDHHLVIGLIHAGAHANERPLVYHRASFSSWVDVDYAGLGTEGLTLDPLGA